MISFRQIHGDGTQSLISSSGRLWQATLLHHDGESTLVGFVSTDLEEAKWMCKLAWEREHAHVCNRSCHDWEPFEP